jgi:hypothetical protein
MLRPNSKPSERPGGILPETEVDAMNLFLTLALLIQDPAGLIEKLKSRDADEAANAREDLLKLGDAALGPIREAAGKAEDAALKKSLAGLAERLEVRKAAQGVAARWGDRWYSVFLNELHVGWAHLKAEEKDGKLVLTDEIRLQPSKDAVTEVRATVVCEKDEYLTPVSLTLDVVSPERTVTATGQVKDGRLVVKSDGQVKAHKLRRNTMVDFAVLRLMTVLPRTEGYEVDVLPLVKPKLPEESTIKADRDESIEFEGRQLKCRRFMLSNADGEDKFYWLDAEHRLLRIQVKDAEIVLSDEKRAKDLDTKE